MDKSPKLVELFQNIGTQIRKARKKNHITLEELAEKCNRDWSYLSQIENAHSTPSIETIFLICESLQIPINSLFDTKEPESCHKLDAFNNKILYLLKDASPKDKKIVIDVIKKVLKPNTDSSPKTTD